MSAARQHTKSQPAFEAAKTLELPRLAYSVEEACSVLGVSWQFWTEHIAAEVRIVRRGRKRLVAVSELQRWLDENGERVLEGYR